MTYFIQEEVNIYTLPQVDPVQIKPPFEVTIGDLHANSMKFIFMLVKHGVVKGLTAEHYAKLVEIYHKVPTATDLEEFNNILNDKNLVFNPEIGIRLIGDECADRGMNDYYILKIFEKLMDKEVPVEILFSNHGLEFIRGYENVINGTGGKSFHVKTLGAGQQQSSQKLHELVEKGLVTEHQVLELITKAYQPILRALSYTLSEDESEITLFSHAGVGLNTIKKLAHRWGIDYQDATAKELAQTIDTINKKFKEHVVNNTILTTHTLQDLKGITKNPLIDLAWNRNYNKEAINRPHNHNHYKINYVHGHGEDHNTALTPEEKQFITNLDNQLGKDIDLNQETYTVIVSSPNTIRHQKQEQKKEIPLEVRGLNEPNTNLNPTNKVETPVAEPVSSQDVLEAPHSQTPPVPTALSSSTGINTSNTTLNPMDKPQDVANEVETPVLQPVSSQDVNKDPLSQNPTDPIPQFFPAPTLSGSSTGSTTVNPTPDPAAKPDDVKDVDKNNLSVPEQQFVKLLSEIKNKKREFKKYPTDPNYKKAYDTAKTLQKILYQQFETLINTKNKSPEDIEEFQKKCKKAITDSRSALEQHRGWKHILGHLALAILGLGIFYALGYAAYKLSGSQFTLFKTESHKKLDQLDEVLKELDKSIRPRV